MLANNLDTNKYRYITKNRNDQNSFTELKYPMTNMDIPRDKIISSKSLTVMLND